MSGEWSRIMWLEIGGVAGMIMLGWVAHAVALLIHPSGILLGADGFLAAAIVGGILGLLVSPLIAAILWKSRLDRSVPFVFGLSALITATWASIVDDEIGITAAVPAVLSVMILCVVARRRFPDPDYIGERICPECGYNLSGCTDEGCPECGWGRRPIEHPPRGF